MYSKATNSQYLVDSLPTFSVWGWSKKETITSRLCDCRDIEHIYSSQLLTNQSRHIYPNPLPAQLVEQCHQTSFFVTHLNFNKKISFDFLSVCSSLTYFYNSCNIYYFHLVITCAQCRHVKHFYCYSSHY